MLILSVIYTPPLTQVLVPGVPELHVVGQAPPHDVFAVVTTRSDLLVTLASRTAGHLGQGYHASVLGLDLKGEKGNK